MSYRDKLRALCSAEEKPSSAAVAQALAGVSKVDLLDFLVEESEKLLALVEDIPNQIYEGLEQQLPTDVTSKGEADALMARLLASGRS